MLLGISFKRFVNKNQQAGFNIIKKLMTGKTHAFVPSIHLFKVSKVKHPKKSILRRYHANFKQVNVCPNVCHCYLEVDVLFLHMYIMHMKQSSQINYIIVFLSKISSSEQRLDRTKKMHYRRTCNNQETLLYNQVLCYYLWKILL